MKAIRVVENCQSNHLSEEILLSNEPLLLKNFVHDWPLVKEAKKSDSAVRDYCALAKKYEIDPLHLALAFCNQRPFMGSVIFGATNANQLRRILKGVDLKLNKEILEEIKHLHKKHPLTF